MKIANYLKKGLSDWLLTPTSWDGLLYINRSRGALYLNKWKWNCTYRPVVFIPVSKFCYLLE